MKYIFNDKNYMTFCKNRRFACSQNARRRQIYSFHFAHTMMSHNDTFILHHNNNNTRAPKRTQAHRKK